MDFCRGPSPSIREIESDFTCLKTFKAYGGTPEEIANAQADIVYVMGVMDISSATARNRAHHGAFQRLVGANPKGYTTKTTFHSWIDGGYFKKTGGIKVNMLVGKVQPATRIQNADDLKNFPWRRLLSRRTK